MNLVIWDLDGTLIDSYPKIVKTLSKVCEKIKYDISDDEIYKYITINSVHEFLNILSQYNEDIKEIYQTIYNNLDYDNKLMNNADYILKLLYQRDYKHIIYTHKGIDTYQILDKLKIKDYFIEIITIDNGFKRKPDPEAMNYIRSKYDVTNAYYVGDRILDMDFAYNAKIKGILYLNKDSYVKANGHETYIVNDLKEIGDILL